MCKRRRSAQPAVVYSGVNAEQVLKDIEIEVRRIIIDCQRHVLTPPPWEIPAAVANEPQQTPAEPPMPSEKELDEIMPLPMKPKKKKLSEIIAAGDNATPLPGQIDIEEAIAAADAAPTPPPVAADPPSPATPTPVQTLLRDDQTLTPVQRLSARWLAFRERRFEARQERRARRRYYKSLEFQVKCNVEPLEELLDFIHDRLE